MAVSQVVIRADWITRAYFIAGVNWIDWRDCFEAAPGEPLPALHRKSRFTSFIRDYSLLRGLKSDCRSALRDWIMAGDRMRRLTSDNDGAGIDAIRDEMENAGFRRERSLLSKLAAFARPSQFVAFDRFAVTGVCVGLGVPRAEYIRSVSYVTYLRDVRGFRKDQLGIAINAFLKEAMLPTDNHLGFELRVLDAYLMLAGGRWRFD